MVGGLEFLVCFVVLMDCLKINDLMIDIVCWLKELGLI